MPTVASAAEPLRFTLRALLHEHRERSGAARLEREGRGPCGPSNAALQRIGGDALALRVEARRVSFGNEQGLAPDASNQTSLTELRLPCRQPRLGELQQLQRRVARQPRFEKAAAGEARSRTRSCECARGIRASKAECVQRRRQQVAVRQQRIGNRLEVVSPFATKRNSRTAAERRPVRETCRPRPPGSAPRWRAAASARPVPRRYPPGSVAPAVSAATA